MERRTSKQVLEMAKQCVELMAAQVSRHESKFGVRELANHMIDSTDRRVQRHLLRFYPSPGDPGFGEFMACVRDTAMFRLWSRTKVAYAMDDLMLHELSETATTKVPTDVLRQLPNENPFLLLPKPDFTDEITQVFRKQIGVPLGAFVFGRYNNAEQLCSTHAEHREDLGIMFIGFIDDDSGLHPITLRCTVPLRGSMLTVEDVVETTVGRFKFNNDVTEAQREQLEIWLRRYVAQVFNSLLYACTDQPDVEVYKPAVNRAGKAKGGKKKKRRERPSDISTVVKFGFRMGPELHEARRRAELRYREAPVGTEKGGWRHPPRQRRGAYRTYWIGPGRETAQLKWVAPYWVSLDLLEPGKEADEVVVRPVRKRK